PWPAAVIFIDHEGMAMPFPATSKMFVTLVHVIVLMFQLVWIVPRPNFRSYQCSGQGDGPQDCERPRQTDARAQPAGNWIGNQP
ncbi:hypothetical protein, partial [Staphylococcus aureus]